MPCDGAARRSPARRARRIPPLSGPTAAGCRPAPAWSSRCVTSGGAIGLWYLRERRSGGTASVAGISRRLRTAAEKLGPTYIKLGQIVASGEGIFPPELVAEFKWCRDEVPAEPWAVVERVLAEDLRRPIDEVFASVERVPLAAASIAQVHAAQLLDGTARRGEGAATGRRPARRPGSGGDGLARPAPGREDPGGRAGQPACARRAVRGDDHRGARLQARGREHARRRHDVRRARTARLRGAAPAPLAGHASHAGDGAAGRVPLLRRHRNALGRASTPKRSCVPP